MHCDLYSRDGRLVGRGPCGLRRDGAIEMVAARPERPVGEGDGPFVLAEGPRRYPVSVERVHHAHDAAMPAAVVYHLVPLVSDADRAAGRGRKSAGY